MADLDAADFGAAFSGAWTRGLLIRRNIADDAFFSTWCPQGTAMETLARIEGHRWAIEDSFAAAKNAAPIITSDARDMAGTGLFPRSCWPSP